MAHLSLFAWSLLGVLAAGTDNSDGKPTHGNGYGADDRFAWIAAIEQHGGVHQLEAKTYFIDRQYTLPNGTCIIGAGETGTGTHIVAVATKPVQNGGHFHGCGVNHRNRIGQVVRHVVTMASVCSMVLGGNRVDVA